MEQDYKLLELGHVGEKVMLTTCGHLPRFSPQPRPSSVCVCCRFWRQNSPEHLKYAAAYRDKREVKDEKERQGLTRVT